MKERIYDALELLFDTLTRPAQAMMHITAGGQFRTGMLIWAFTIILPCISALVQMRHGSVLLVAGAFVGGAVSLFFQTLLVHGAALLLGGHGQARNLAAAFCFADFPLNFAILLSSLVFILPTGLVQGLSVAALLWAVVLAAYAVRANYGMGMGRSCIALFLPLLIVLGLLAVLFMYIVVEVVSLVGTL